MGRRQLAPALLPGTRRAGAGPELRERVAAEITTTFASTYTATVSLEEALSVDAVSVYGRQATDEKYLIDPSR